MKSSQASEQQQDRPELIALGKRTAYKRSNVLTQASKRQKLDSDEAKRAPEEILLSRILAEKEESPGLSGGGPRPDEDSVAVPSALTIKMKPAQAETDSYDG